MDFREQMNEKIMSKDRTDDFLSQFPLVSFLHDNSILYQHLERRSDSVGFHIIVFVVVLVKLLDEIGIDNFDKGLEVEIGDSKVKVWINFFKKLNWFTISFVIV